MKPILLLFLIINFTTFCRAQVFDDFDDGNFSENPVWLGDDSLFTINIEKQLQLNAATTGEAFLSLNYNKSDEMEWQFWIKEKFTPSANNYCDVYLYSDNVNLQTSNLAYILRFGETGSNDVIELLQLKDGQYTSICRGNDTFIASSFSTSVKVTYDDSKKWNIYIDKNGENCFLLECNGLNEDFSYLDGNAFFGFNCIYTNSNIKQFYFDDIYIGDIIVDSIAPELLVCDITDDFHIKLEFSEAIEENSALNIKNYYIENHRIHPKNVNYGNNYSTIILEFENAINEEIYQTLVIENIEDFGGNISKKINHTFLYYNAKEYDIVINEIMADPSPPIELPEYEYIELYNTTDFPININNWKLTVGNTELPINKNTTIQGNDYLILCHNDAVEKLSEFGNCLSFSSFQITNSGTTLSLIDRNNHLVSSVEFKSSWHSSSYKEDGGWSLEQIDYKNPCAGESNWSSSNCIYGGTPGKTNSIYNDNIIPPKLIHVNPNANNSVELFFNQNMNMKSLQTIENYFIKEINKHPSEINIIQNKNNYVELVFNQEFIEEHLYTLNINNVKNCKDIGLEKEIDIVFGISQQADSNDVIINEILFNPISPGVDYVEIYNRSEKVIDLSKIMIGNIKESFPNPPDTVVKEICSDSRILLPHSYVLLSTDGKIVKEQYDCDADNFIDMNSFPSMPNEEGRIIICNKTRKIIDEVYYSEKMHYDLLIVTQGVSLERIAFDNSSSDKNNWHSASFDVNYGTPGYKNSMSVDFVKTEEEKFSIVPEIFSPDGDGFDDNCAIFYELKKQAVTINITIFNSKGILVKSMLNNSLTDGEGFLTWNGCDDNNHRVEPGIYIVQIELFDLEGNVERKRKVVVVATK